MLEKKIILDVGITNATKHEVLEYIIKGLEKNGKKYFVVTPNPEILVLAHKAKIYKNILNNAEIALPDGVGVIIAGKILGNRFKGRTTGVELLENLCRVVAEKPITVGFLGGRSGVAEETAECLVKKYLGLKVGFVGEEWIRGSSRPLNDSSSPNLKQPANLARAEFSNNSSLSRLFKSSFRGETRPFGAVPKVDILFVAFGAPKQEIWMSDNLDKLPVKVAIGVGGAFDYISGKIPRAPTWIQKIGFEWLFRLIIQPWRLKRQLKLLEFTYLVLRERFKLH